MDFLMARYNMAHAKAEWRLFPVALAGRAGGGVHDDAMELPLQRAPAVGRRSTEHRHVHALGGGAPRRAGGAQQRARRRVPGRMGGRTERRAFERAFDGETETGGYKYVAPPDAEMEKWRAYGELVYDESAAFETLF